MNERKPIAPIVLVNGSTSLPKFYKLTEHWRLVPEYVKELHQRREHEAAKHITQIALEEPSIK